MYHVLAHPCVPTDRHLSPEPPPHSFMGPLAHSFAYFFIHPTFLPSTSGRLIYLKPRMCLSLDLIFMWIRLISFCPKATGEQALRVWLFTPCQVSRWIGGNGPSGPALVTCPFDQGRIMRKKFNLNFGSRIQEFRIPFLLT